MERYHFRDCKELHDFKQEHLSRFSNPVYEPGSTCRFYDNQGNLTAVQKIEWSYDIPEHMNTALSYYAKSITVDMKPKTVVKQRRIVL